METRFVVRRDKGPMSALITMNVAVVVASSHLARHCPAVQAGGSDSVGGDASARASPADADNDSPALARQFLGAVLDLGSTPSSASADSEDPRAGGSSSSSDVIPPTPEVVVDVDADGSNTEIEAFSSTSQSVSCSISDFSDESQNILKPVNISGVIHINCSEGEIANETDSTSKNTE